MTAQETAQNVLRGHFARLAQAISDPLVVATELFEKEIVSESLLGRIRDVQEPDYDKNTRLLQAVLNQIATDAGRFQTFLAILRKDVLLHPLVESMETMWGRMRDQRQDQQHTRDSRTAPESTSLIADSAASKQKQNGSDGAVDSQRSQHLQLETVQSQFHQLETQLQQKEAAQQELQSQLHLLQLEIDGKDRTVDSLRGQLQEKEAQLNTLQRERLQNPQDLHKTDKIPPVPPVSVRVIEAPLRTVVVVGSTGCGKSTIANKIIGLEKFYVGNTVGRLGGATKVPNHCNVTLTLASTSYHIRMVDTPGFCDIPLAFSYFKGPNRCIMQNIITHFKEYVQEGVHLVLFVLKKGILTPEEKLTFDFLFQTLDISISRHSALVITHCEDCDDARRQQIVCNFRRQSYKIAEYMKKGIYTVGFPHPDLMRPDVLQIYMPEIERDQETLRKLVFRCDEKKPANKMFTESPCSIS